MPKSAKRPIPPDLEPVVAQALLNMYLRCTPAELEAARSQALDLADMINGDYDKWLKDRRQRTAEQPKQYNQNRRQQVPL